MTNLLFQFHLQSRHGAAGNDSLRVDVRNGELEPWQPLEPSLQTPGFRLYLLALLHCQHHDLVANAVERHLPLAAVDGVLSVTAPDLDGPTLAVLERHMKVCPVSRNLPGTVSKSIVVLAAG